MPTDAMSRDSSGAFRARDDYEYCPLRIDGATSGAATATMLSVHAEFTGWELARVLRYPDGSRRVTLRRRRTAGPAAALSI